MARAKRDPGAEPRPKAPPKTDPLEGLDYTVEKDGGRWKAECLGVVSYGTTKKQALVMLAGELNGFKDTESVTMAPTSVAAWTSETSNDPSVAKQASGIINKAVEDVRQLVTGPALAQAKGESYTIEDAELLWGIDYPNKPELLRQLIVERIELKANADAIKDRIDTINKSLLSFFDRQGVESVKMEDWTVARVNGASSTLDKEALVLAGVPAELIVQCTKRKEYTTVRVTGPKGGE